MVDELRLAAMVPKPVVELCNRSREKATKRGLSAVAFGTFARS